MRPLATNSMDPPLKLTESVAAGEDAVLDWLRKQVSRKMLEEIAESDRGEEVHEHLSGIQMQLYTPEPTLGLLAWNPREVLELERWSQPDIATRDLPPTGRRGHVKRALASTILLRNVGHIADPKRTSEEEFFIETSATTLIRLTESAIAIGDQMPYFTLQFLFWFYCSQRCAIIRPFAAFCILLLVAAEHDRFRDSDIADTCRWCLAVEESSRTALGSDIASDAWLIGLSMYEDRKDHREIWAAVATRVFASWHSDATVASFADISKRLASRV